MTLHRVPIKNQKQTNKQKKWYQSIKNCYYSLLKKKKVKRFDYKEKIKG